MRLNKYIAQAGIASRRKADQLIENGNVKVNGTTVKEMGFITSEGDVVEVNGVVIEPVTKMEYIMLNKPKGYITAMSDDRERPVVADLVSDVGTRVFPVGRLDADTTGLLIMTNDGDVANRLAHPSHEVVKIYRALVSGVLSPQRAAKLRKGVDIGGYTTAEACVKIIKQVRKNTLVEIGIHEGKNRQVRKMCAAVGNKVLELERVSIGEIYLGRLMEGHYRKLKKEEIEYLKSL